MDVKFYCKNVNIVTNFRINIVVLNQDLMYTQI